MQKKDVAIKAASFAFERERKMDKREILSHVDHTLLAVTSTREEIMRICDEGIKYGTASVCIPASYVKSAAEYARGRVKICTVIGFPNGYDTTEAKVFMAKDAIEKGADEVDMVINLGMVKDGLYGAVRDEIWRVKDACGENVLKVIIECCRLTDEEKINMCRVVSESGADYIKTSTGFGGGGATEHDVALMAKMCAPHLKIKAAGGIRSFEDAEKFLALGADRLGTSALVGLMEKENN